MRVFKLGYVNLITKNISKMLTYYEDVLGLSLIESGYNGEKYLSTGLDHHNVILTPGDENRLSAIGYQINDNVTLLEAKRTIESHGIKVEHKENPNPGITELIEFKDPGGYTIQIYNEMKEAGQGFKENGIVPIKLGHVALGYEDYVKAVKFYESVLNFDLTDHLGELATFMTCNSDHHSLNCVNIGHNIVHHIAFELKDASHQYNSSDILAKNKIPIFWGPSRHTAGHNIASYHHDPDENVIELFIDMDKYIPELGYFEPRPWHKTLPMKPQKWTTGTAWDTEFLIGVTKGALKKVQEQE